MFASEFFILLLACSCYGSPAQNYMVVSTATPIENTHEVNATYESFCSRSFKNTALIGANPYQKLLFTHPADCFKTCIETYPRCVAVVYYNLHSGDYKNVCYTFDKNSISPEVTLIPEKPKHEADLIRTLEIVPDCHNFDPVPPPQDDWVVSSDKVDESSRVVQTINPQPIMPTGRWSPWTNCRPRTYQVRSIECDYGYMINRRRCEYSQTAYTVPRQTIIAINLPYPPQPYYHPECHSEESMRYMHEHINRMREICCVMPKKIAQPTEAYPQFKQSPEEQVTEIPTTPAPIPMTQQCEYICQPRIEPQYTDTYHIHDDTTLVRRNYTDVERLEAPYWLQWSEWSLCGVTCGFGTQTRYRSCSADECAGGPSLEIRKCEGLEECNTWAQWGMWSTCDAKCGAGKRYRSRWCHLGRDRCVGKDFEEEDCYAKESCPEWGPWGPWAYCSATCGQGTKTRTRACYFGDCAQLAGDSVETIACELVPCSMWSEWEDWSICSASCGVGNRQRKRICLTGDNCDGPEYETEQCIHDSCAEWGPWSPETACSASCGYGVTLKRRQCFGNGVCIGDKEIIQKCFLQECSEWSPWTEWSGCSTTCGEGEQVRKRDCLGLDCIGESLEVRQCVEVERCSIWSAWYEWSGCSQTCGHGVRSRSRFCDGAYCPGPRMEMEKCENLPPCSEWAPWNEWSSCSATCGNGEQTRIRTCVGGDSCLGESRDVQHCTHQTPCPNWTMWGEWSDCDQPCGHGQKYRSRVCMGAGYAEPNACEGASNQTAECSEMPCCEWTAWTVWSDCDRRCGGGRIERARQCLRPGRNSPDDETTCFCPGVARESLPCNSEPCPRPTRITYALEHELGKKEVRLGTQKDCVQYPQACQYQPAPKPMNGTSCQYTNWCDWTPCNTCRHGKTTRHRYCLPSRACQCSGPQSQEMGCPYSEQCRKKK